MNEMAFMLCTSDDDVVKDQMKEMFVADCDLATTEKKASSCCACATAMVVQNRKRGRKCGRRLIGNDKRDGCSCCVLW